MCLNFRMEGYPVYMFTSTRIIQVMMRPGSDGVKAGPGDFICIRIFGTDEFHGRGKLLRNELEMISG